MHHSNSDIWLAGALAAFTVDFIVYPLDTLKTRIQSPKYRELYIDAVTGVTRREVLFRGLYQGIWSVVIATLPSSGAFFSTYEGVKHVLHSDVVETNDMLPFALPSSVINGLASSAAECVSCFILTPAEVLKQNAQMVASTHNNDSTKHNTKSLSLRASPTKQFIFLFRHHPTKLWRGYGALVARNLPFTAIQFPLFEHLREQALAKRYNQKQSHNKNISEAENMTERAFITALSAGAAGGIAAAITTPIDVVKTRTMLSAGKAERDSTVGLVSWKKTKNTSKGTFSIGRDIYRTEGIRGLFKGGILRAGWTALGLGLYLSTYETGMMYFKKRNLEKSKDDAMGI